jgi:hypothetical protein
MSTTTTLNTGPAAGLDRRSFTFYLAVVAIQGVHVFEHVVQLLQVYLFSVPDDDALALLGYVFQVQGTEEWLHLVFNLLYVGSLYALLFPLRRLHLAGTLPTWALAAFVGGVLLESWHVVEHLVIIANVLRNSGCPCPGIGDAALGVTDTQLHFAYNLLAYAATLAPLPSVLAAGPQTSGRTSSSAPT